MLTSDISNLPCGVTTKYISNEILLQEKEQHWTDNMLKKVKAHQQGQVSEVVLAVKLVLVGGPLKIIGEV